MNKFNDLVKENGFLTEEGVRFFKPFSDVLDKILYSPEFREFSSSQIRVLGSILLTQIQTAITNKIQHKNVDHVKLKVTNVDDNLI